MSDPTTQAITDIKVVHKNAKDENINLFLQPIKTIAAIFAPIIPALVAGGSLLAIYNLISAKGLFFANMSLLDVYPQYTAVADMLNLLATAPFIFLPILIGFSATRAFGGNGYLGAALGMMMIHPELMSLYQFAKGVIPADVALDTTMAGLELSRYGYTTDPEIAKQALKEGLNLPVLGSWQLFEGQVAFGNFVVADGHIAKVGFQGMVLPVLLMSWVLAKIETLFHKILPNFLDSFLTPIFALFSTVFITFICLSPIMLSAASALTYALEMLSSSHMFRGANSALTNGVLGLFYAPIEILGLNQSLSTIELSQLTHIAKTGGSYVFPVIVMSSIAQGGAALAAMFTAKDKKLKGIASVTGVSAVLGVPEPAMFGINLRLRYPFYAAIISASIASVVVAIFNVKSISASIQSVAGIPGITAIDTNHWFYFAVGMAISFLCAFLATLVLANTRFNPEYSKKHKNKQPHTDVQAEVAPLTLEEGIDNNEIKTAKSSDTQNNTFSSEDTNKISENDTKHAVASDNQENQPINHLTADTSNISTPNVDGLEEPATVDSMSVKNNTETAIQPEKKNTESDIETEKSEIHKTKVNQEAVAFVMGNSGAITDTRDYSVANVTESDIALEEPLKDSQAASDKVANLSNKQNANHTAISEADASVEDTVINDRNTNTQDDRIKENATANSENNSHVSSEETVDYSQLSNSTEELMDESDINIVEDWLMPLKGHIITLQEVPDTDFSSGVMGAGFAIQPETNSHNKLLLSPVNGKVSAVFPSRHALCIDTRDYLADKADDILEVLIHVGIDTQQLDGNGFKLLVQEGEEVAAGTPLLEIDWDVIEEKASSTITPVCFTSLNNGETVEIQEGKPVLVS